MFERSQIAVTRSQVLKAISRALAGGPKLKPSVDAAFTTASMFFNDNGFGDCTEIGQAFLERLDRVIETRGLVSEGLQFSPPASDVKMLETMQWISLALEALLERDFSSAVLRGFDGLPSEIDRAEICRRTGLDQSFFARMRISRPRFARISSEQALKLDEALGCRGKVYFSFIATDQRAAHVPDVSIRSELVKSNRFNAMLHCLVIKSESSKAQLAATLAEQTAIPITASHVDSWCLRSLPTERMEPVVQALDQILRADGTLLKQWRIENPRKNLNGYGLREREWTAELREQVDQIEKTMTRLAENYADTEVKEPKGGDRRIQRGTSGEFASLSLVTLLPNVISHLRNSPYRSSATGNCSKAGAFLCTTARGPIPSRAHRGQ